MGHWAWEMSQCVKVLTAEPSEQLCIHFQIPQGERKEPVSQSRTDALHPRVCYSFHETEYPRINSDSLMHRCSIDTLR